jgi:hypothetical protein
VVPQCLRANRNSVHSPSRLLLMRTARSLTKALMTLPAIARHSYVLVASSSRRISLVARADSRLFVSELRSLSMVLTRPRGLKTPRMEIRLL